MTQEKESTPEDIAEELFRKLENTDPKDIKISIGDENILEIWSSTYKPDLMLRIGDTIVMIGLQRSVVEIEDMKKFMLFISEYDLKRNDENRKIVFAVISTAEKSKTAEYKINEQNSFVFPIISVEDFGENEVVTALMENKTIRIKETEM